MDLPFELKDAAEKLASAYGLAKLKETSQLLSERYRNESGEGKVLLSNDIEATAYALVRMPATFGAVSDALGYALDFYDGEINTLIDAGAGSGAASWAADSRIYLDNITCIEREGAMRRIGEKLMKDSYLNKAEWISADLTDSNIKKSADLVVSSYVMNEMSAENRIKVAKSLWNMTEKILLIVEPGTPAGFSVLKDVRDYLLKNGAHIIAPCTHEEKCRLSDDDWCHFTCRVQRSKMHKIIKDADVPYEDEKYSYMAFVKEECNRAEARILRHPYIEKGQISLELCTENENKKIVVTKKNKDLFKSARKAKQGDAIVIL